MWSARDVYVTCGRAVHERRLRKLKRDTNSARLAHTKNPREGWKGGRIQKKPSKKPKRPRRAAPVSGRRSRHGSRVSVSRVRPWVRKAKGNEKSDRAIWQKSAKRAPNKKQQGQRIQGGHRSHATPAITPARDTTVITEDTVCARRRALWRVRDAKGRDSGAAVGRACSQRRALRFSAFRRACVRPVCLRCLARVRKVARLRLENLVHAWCGRQATSKLRLRCREPQGDAIDCAVSCDPRSGQSAGLRFGLRGPGTRTFS